MTYYLTRFFPDLNEVLDPCVLFYKYNLPRVPFCKCLPCLKFLFCIRQQYFQGAFLLYVNYVFAYTSTHIFLIVFNAVQCIFSFF